MAEQNLVLYVGIDLGTTFSSVCVRNPNTEQYEMIQTEFLHNNFPSIVAFTASGVKVGEAALGARPQDTISEVKRLMGKYENLADEDMEKLKEKLTNPIVVRDDKRLGLEISRKKGKEIRKQVILPEVISTMVLMKIKEMIEKRFPVPKELKHKQKIYCVVGVPASFGDSERMATTNAIKMSGMIPLQLVNEPTAAAKAYNIEQGNLLVYDFGGGTLDISIIKYTKENGKTKGQVLKSVGDAYLGGNDIDYKIADYLEEQLVEFITDNLPYDESDAESMVSLKSLKIKRIAEEMKKELSAERTKKNNNVKVVKEIADFGVVDEDELEDVDDAELELTYDKFVELNSDVITKCEDLLNAALDAVGFLPQQIDKVIMTGGSCKNPFVREMLLDKFGKERLDLSQNDFDLLVTKGAAMFANNIGNGISTVDIGDITTYDIGVKVKDYKDGELVEINHIVVPKGTSLPLKKGECKVVVTTPENSMNAMFFNITENGNDLAQLEITSLPQLPAGCVDIQLDFYIQEDAQLVISATVIKPSSTEKKQPDVETKVRPAKKNTIQEELDDKAKYIFDLYHGQIKFWDE